MTVFETETMAELCVRQGLVSEGLAIYRRLVDAAGDADTRTRRKARLAELERIAASAARGRAGGRSDGDVARFRSHTPGPPSPSPAQPVSARPADEAFVDFERREDALTFTWALPPGTAAPALQLLLVIRGPDGVEAQSRTLPLDHPAGTTTLRVAGLHSLRAAVGRLDEGRFVPIARLPAGEP